MPHEYPATTYPTGVASPTTPNETQELSKGPRFQTWYKGCLTRSEIYERMFPDGETSALRIDGPSEGALVLNSIGAVKIITGKKSKELGAGSGKLCIHSWGQQQLHENKSCIEYNAGEGEKEALNVIAYGDYVEQSVGGTRYIKAQKIVIEATEELLLVGKNQVTIQAGSNGGGSINMVAGQITKATNNEKEIITGQKLTFGVSESTTVQFDPRSSTNTVSTGHMNHKFLGDVKQYITGVEQRIIGGATFSVPFVKARDTSYSVNTVIGGASIKAADTITVAAGGAATVTAGGAASLVGATTSNVTSSGTVNISGASTTNITSAGTTNITGTSSANITSAGAINVIGVGNVNIKGALILLN